MAMQDFVQEKNWPENKEDMLIEGLFLHLSLWTYSEIL